MNLLGIQDALKNASDQQLMQLMQSPDSTAPSYLVLSELRRRKEMRAQQAQRPNSTVAQDLTSEENMQAPMGIRSLSTPEPGDEEYPTEEDDGIQAMREGGPVRMYEGDKVEAKEGDERSRAGQLFDYATGQWRSAVEDAPRAAGVREEISNRMLSNNPISYLFGSPTAHTRAGQEIAYLRANQGNRQFDLEAFRRDPAAYMQANPIGPRVTATPPAAPPPAAQSPAASGPTAAQTNDAIATARVQPGPGAGPGAGPGIRALGGGAAPAAAAPAAAAPPALPTMQENMERNLNMFPGIPQELLDRIRESRTNEGDRRKEAQNMALIEAGLRIASSNNPRLGAAIAEGAAPAVQSYTQQLGQIRQDQNADITRELAVAQADLNRRYMVGQISAAELQRQTQMLDIQYRDAASRRTEAGNNARASQALSREEFRAGEAIRRDQLRADEAARAASIRAIEQTVERTMADPGRVAMITSTLKRTIGRDPTRDELVEEITREAIDRSTRVNTAFARLSTGNSPRANSTVVQP